MVSSKSLGSVEKAIHVVNYLSKQDADGVSLGQLAKDLGVNKASIHHTLSTLKLHHWIQQHPETGYYQLGMGLAEIAAFFTNQKTIKQILHPILMEISSTLNELVHLGTVVERDILYLDKVEPNRSIRVVSQIGKRVFAASTALGRAVIGSKGLSAEQLAWFSEGASPKLAASFKQNCQQVVKLGWSSEIEENEIGIACVAVPLLLHGKAEYAISVTAPIERMDAKKRLACVQAIVRGMKTLPPAYGISIPEVTLK